MEKKNSKVAYWLLGFLAACNVLAWIAVYDLSRPGLLAVNFFDVGQGDAVFIETPRRQQILIDGGPNAAILQKLAKEMPFWDREIDMVILTHPDQDHIAGLLDVFKNYKVDNILWTGVKKNSANYREWLKAIQEEGANVMIARAGERFLFIQKDKAKPEYLEIIYPKEDFNGREVKNTNITSVAGRLVYGQVSFLFTGDIDTKAEKELIADKDILKADIFKMGHHGSKTSNSEEFLQRVAPAAAVFQIGRNNRYGFPPAETLAKLEKFGIKIFRTDINGDVKVLSDGEHYKIIKNN